MLNDYNSVEQSMSQRQHYVPQFYLRGWTSSGEGLVWLYRKGRPPRRVSIRKAGQEPDFYAFTDDEGVYDGGSVEKELEKLDTAAAPVIKKIEDRAPITTAERELLSRFISVLWRRVPQHREVVNDTFRELLPACLERLREDFAAWRAAGKNPERIDKLEKEVQRIEELYGKEVPAYFFTNNLRRDSVFEEALARMDWAFLQATPDTPFLTCDNPVLYNEGSGIGDAERGIVLFPLSKELMLQAMWATSFRGACVPIPDAEVRRLNRYVVENAHREVYASVKSSGFMALVNKRMGD